MVCPVCHSDRVHIIEDHTECPECGYCSNIDDRKPKDDRSYIDKMISHDPELRALGRCRA